MSFDQIFAKNRLVWPVFEELATNNVIEMIKDKNELNAHINYNKIKTNIAYKVAKDMAIQGSHACIEAFLAGKVLTEGPRIIRPRQIDFESLEQINVTLPFEEYHQPFSTIIVELPQDYYTKKTVPCAQYGDDRYFVEMPKEHQICLVILHHDVEKQLIIAGGWFTTSQVITIGMWEGCIKDKSNLIRSVDNQPNLIDKSNLVNTIEDALTINEHNGGNYTTNEMEANAATTSIRAAINTILLIDELGIKNNGPSNSKYFNQCKDRYERAKKRKDKEKIELNQKEMLRCPIIYSFNQEIELFDREYKDKNNQNINYPSGYTVKAHWRRGYWKMQPYGTGSSLRKRIRIKPILIHPEQFVGPNSIIYK